MLINYFTLHRSDIATCAALLGPLLYTKLEFLILSWFVNLHFFSFQFPNPIKIINQISWNFFIITICFSSCNLKILEKVYHVYAGLIIFDIFLIITSQGNGSCLCYHPLKEYILVGCHDGRLEYSAKTYYWGNLGLWH